MVGGHIHMCTPICTLNLRSTYPLGVSRHATSPRLCVCVCFSRVTHEGYVKDKDDSVRPQTHILIFWLPHVW